MNFRRIQGDRDMRALAGGWAARRGPPLPRTTQRSMGNTAPTSALDQEWDTPARKTEIPRPEGHGRSFLIEEHFRATPRCAISKPRPEVHHLGASCRIIFSEAQSPVSVSASRLQRRLHSAMAKLFWQTQFRLRLPQGSHGIQGQRERHLQFH